MAKGLWQPPSLRLEKEGGEKQKATWLELFYDLIFVVAIAQLAHNLSAHVSLEGFAGFVALFFPVWWCWINAIFYATRFDTDDLIDRLLTLLQMAIIASLAVNVHHGLSSSSIGFALAYAASQTVLIVQYIVAGYHVEEARLVSRWFTIGYGISVLLWVASVFIPIPWRFTLWTLAIIFDLATPLTSGKLLANLPLSTHHVPERFGLFTIIVLGESAASVVRAVREEHWHLSSVIVAIWCLLIAFSIWWIYFDNLEGSMVQEKIQKQPYALVAWVYSHFPLVVGITATGVGVEKVILGLAKTETILPPGERWLFCGSIALCLIFIAIIHWISCYIGKKGKKNKVLSYYHLGSAAFILILAVAGNSLSALLLTTLVTVACVAQVVVDLTYNKSIANLDL